MKNTRYPLFSLFLLTSSISACNAFKFEDPEAYRESEIYEESRESESSLEREIDEIPSKIQDDADGVQQLDAQTSDVEPLVPAQPLVAQIPKDPLPEEPLENKPDTVPEVREFLQPTSELDEKQSELYNELRCDLHENPMFDGCERLSDNDFLSLINSGVNVNFVTEEGTAVAVALKHKQSDATIRALIKAGANPIVGDSIQYVYTADNLRAFIEAGVDTSQLSLLDLIRNGAEADAFAELLAHPYKQEEVNLLEALLNVEPELTKDDCHDVSRDDYYEMCDCEEEYRVNYADSVRKYQIASLLLDSDAIGNISKNSESLIKSVLSSQNNYSVIFTLLEHGLDIHLKVDGESLTELVMKRADEETFFRFLEQPIDVNERFSTGETLLQYALETEMSPEVIDKLIEKGADVRFIAEDGRTPIQCLLDGVGDTYKSSLLESYWHESGYDYCHSIVCDENWKGSTDGPCSGNGYTDDRDSEYINVKGAIFDSLLKAGAELSISSPGTSILEYASAHSYNELIIAKLLKSGNETVFELQRSEPERRLNDVKAAEQAENPPVEAKANAVNPEVPAQKGDDVKAAAQAESPPVAVDANAGNLEVPAQNGDEGKAAENAEPLPAAVDANAGKAEVPAQNGVEVNVDQIEDKQAASAKLDANRGVENELNKEGIASDKDLNTKNSEADAIIEKVDAKQEMPKTLQAENVVDKIENESQVPNIPEKTTDNPVDCPELLGNAPKQNDLPNVIAQDSVQAPLVQTGEAGNLGSGKPVDRRTQILNRIAKELLNKSYLVNVTGDTLDVMNILKTMGADFSYHSEDNCNALLLDAFNHQAKADIISFLIENNTNIQQLDACNSLVNIAIVKDYEDTVISSLITAGAGIDSENSTSALETLLNSYKDWMCESCGGWQEEMSYEENRLSESSSKFSSRLKAIVNNGGNIDIKLKNGNTPLLEAVKAKHPNYVIEEIIEAGAKVNARDEDNKTPLMFVTNRDIADLLESKGANLRAKDNNGKRAKDYMKENIIEENDESEEFY